VVSELGVENQYSKAASQELTALVVQSDAVITTPSTAILEAMLLERPVAALDYHNAPTFVPTAWTVSAKDHLGPVLSELLKPTARKMAFQRDCLRDCLRCDGAAAPRVVALLRKMVRLAAIAKGNGTRLKLPSNVIEAGAYQWGTCQAPRLDQLYPDHEAFQESDIVALQLKVARLESERTRLQSQLNTRSIIRSLVSRMCQQWKRKRRSQVV
jgi:hypothetical protein